ncbi:MAG: hypothetical protein AAGA75_21620 [Cyanobacteria bacterium P01_E01_bin.6]
MWTSEITPLPMHQGIQITIEGDSQPLSYRDVLHHWQHHDAFRSFFINLLAASPFPAFRWETPPMTRAIAHRPFECVLLDSPDLIRKADVHTFADYFHPTSQPSIIEFPNLGNDAWLVVPCPETSPSAYGHLGTFIRQAPEQQKHTLWQVVGAAMEHRLGTTPIWLSTAGGGVSWLHVRLDDRPKYYGYAPYRKVT